MAAPKENCFPVATLICPGHRGSEGEAGVSATVVLRLLATPSAGPGPRDQAKWQRRGAVHRPGGMLESTTRSRDVTVLADTAIHAQTIWMRRKNAQEAKRRAERGGSFSSHGDIVLCSRRLPRLAKAMAQLRVIDIVKRKITANHGDAKEATFGSAFSARWIDSRRHFTLFRRLAMSLQRRDPGCGQRHPHAFLLPRCCTRSQRQAHGLPMAGRYRSRQIGAEQICTWSASHGAELLEGADRRAEDHELGAARPGGWGNHARAGWPRPFRFTGTTNDDAGAVRRYPADPAGDPTSRLAPP